MRQNGAGERPFRGENQDEYRWRYGALMERYDMTKERLDAVTPEREARGAGKIR
jgi:hypothetical protein